VPHRDEDYLILSTIHSAKGQEWKAVYVLNAVDGCIPSEMATGSAEEIEEERRILYVAMTRARDQLTLLLPQRFYIHQQARRGDRHVYAARSRFIPAGILDRFEMRTWPPAAQTAIARQSSAATVDLMSRMRGRWQRTGT
jgi:DNA helicase-2/ATP-dependent DNA helicase PcrA